MWIKVDVLEGEPYGNNVDLRICCGITALEKS